MLILQRKLNEVLHIGQDVQVRLLAINRDRVSLGVVAPDDCLVVRGELLASPLRLDGLKTRREGGCVHGTV